MEKTAKLRTAIILTVFAGLLGVSAQIDATNGIEFRDLEVSVCYKDSLPCAVHKRRASSITGFHDSFGFGIPYDADYSISAKELWKACKFVAASNTTNGLVKTNVLVCRYIQGNKVPFKVEGLGYTPWLYLQNDPAMIPKPLPTGYIAELTGVSLCSGTECQVEKALQDTFCAKKGFGAIVAPPVRLDVRGNSGFEGLEPAAVVSFLDDAAKAALGRIDPERRAFASASAVWAIQCSGSPAFN